MLLLPPHRIRSISLQQELRRSQQPPSCSLGGLHMRLPRRHPGPRGGLKSARRTRRPRTTPPVRNKFRRGRRHAHVSRSRRRSSLPNKFRPGRRQAFVSCPERPPRRHAFSVYPDRADWSGRLCSGTFVLVVVRGHPGYIPGFPRWIRILRRL